MSDVLFVIPTKKSDIMQDFSGTMLLATILRQKGIDVDIYHFYEAEKENGFDSFVKESADNILSKNPKIVSFYCRCDCYLADIMIAKEIKKQNECIYTVLGGPQADASAYNTLKELPWIDFCCRGEGETTVYPLFSALLNGNDYTATKGLSYRDKENNIIENPVAELIKDLDTIPFIDYSFIKPENINQNGIVPIDVGRGCPFNCAYCSTSLFWKRRFRLKSTDRIIKEMNLLNERFGYEKFRFEHDLFTADKKRVKDFAQKLKALGKNYTWSCSSRIDTLDEETIDAMIESGLKSIYIGVESGSERMQKLINKNLKINDVIHIISILAKHNIKITASFMYGFPEETEEDLELTLQLAHKLRNLGVKNLQFHLCAITQGTQYYNQYKDQLTFSVTQSNINGDFGIEECMDFIKEHSDIFCFFYEYQSEFREKYADLSIHARDTLVIYNTLCTLLPDEYQNKKISEIAFDIISAHKDCKDNNSPYSKGLKYISNKYTGDKLQKLQEIFRFYDNQHQALRDSDFQSSVEIYGIDVSALNKNKCLDEIECKNSIVYFNKINDQLKINIKLT